MYEIEQFAIQVPTKGTGGPGFQWLTASGEWTSEPLAALILTDWLTASRLANSLPYLSARVETRRSYIAPMPGAPLSEVKTTNRKDPWQEKFEDLVMQVPSHILSGSPPPSTPSR